MRKISLLILLLFLSSSLFADQVTLKNGDRLTGSIVKSDGKTLVLHTDYAGDITVKFDAVQAIQSDQQLHVEVQGGKPAAGTVTTSDGNVEVHTTNGPVPAPLAAVTALRNDKEQAAYEESLHPGFLQEWNTGVNVGFALTRGNSQTKNLSLGFLATRQTLHDKLNAYANSVYATNDAPGAVPSTTANAAGGGVRYDHDIHERIFAFAATDFFADALQGLNLRSVLGGGAGYHAIKNKNTTLDFLLGANYTHESYVLLTRNFAALTVGEDLTTKIGKGTVLTQAATFFPDLSDTGEYRATFALGTVTKLNKWLGWQNSVSDIYVTNPPNAAHKNDLILTTGFSLSLTP